MLTKTLATLFILFFMALYGYFTFYTINNKEFDSYVWNAGYHIEYIYYSIVALTLWFTTLILALAGLIFIWGGKKDAN